MKNGKNPSQDNSIRSGSKQALMVLGVGTLLITAFFFATFLYSEQFLSVPNALPGSHVVGLFNATAALTVIAFLITQVILFLSVYKFRQRKERKAAYVRGHLKLELVWTIVPAIVFIVLFLWGQRLWNQINLTPEGNPVVIEIMAEQFNWHARYAGPDKELGRSDFRFISAENVMGIDPNDPYSADDFIPLQMHVPKDRPVVLRLHSKDVIHSFFVPSFHVKMDAVPGMTTTVHFTATYSTNEMRSKLVNPEFNYEVACAELCGNMHFAMKLILVVDEQDQFDEWYRNQTDHL